MGRQFAISDIHGCARTFRQLVTNEIQFNRNDTLYLLGDYLNKGPDSKGVFDFIFDLKKEGYEVNCLRGNHEQYLIEGLKFPWEEIEFLNRGGFDTLDSFGVKTVHDIPQKYLEFITALPYYVEIDHYLLIHAGLNFDLQDPYKDDFSMLNIRKMVVDLGKTGNKKLIHGHVPTPYSEIKNSLDFNDLHISIDAGCVYDHIHALNHLVALEIQPLKLYIQKNID